MSSDHLPILIGLQTTVISSPAQHRSSINLKKVDWTGYRREIERKLSSCHLPTDCQKDDKLFRATLLKAVYHHVRGCNKGASCQYAHPKLCRASLTSKRCDRRNCYYYHVAGTLRPLTDIVPPKKQVSSRPIPLMQMEVTPPSNLLPSARGVARGGGGVHMSPGAKLQGRQNEAYKTFTRVKTIVDYVNYLWQ